MKYEGSIWIGFYMGHQRLGRLPASKQWREIVDYLASGDISVAELANKVADACDKSFAAATKDPAFQKALHLLCQIPLAAKHENLSEGLAKIGINVSDNPSRTDILVGFERAMEQAQRDGSKNITDLSEMAKQAGIAALNTLFQGPPPVPQMDFWKTPKGDTHRHLEAACNPEGFGDMAQNFFSTLAKDNIKYFMDREMPRHLGSGGLSHSISDMDLFDQSVERHCREASYIMRAFARDWNANAVYNQKKNLTQKDVTGFAHIAVDKMRKEFRFRNEGYERY